MTARAIRMHALLAQLDRHFSLNFIGDNDTAREFLHFLLLLLSTFL